jgi:GT2 family glycosyltransferase
VVVVDNASSDGSDVAVQQRFPQVEVRRNPVNEGFPGNNAAFGDLGGVDYVALVNNDAFVEPGWLRPLEGALHDDPSLGAACPKLLLAPRFREVVVEAATFRPGGADPRELSVRVSGVDVAGADRWRDAWFGPGCNEVEVGPGSETRFRWLGGRAHLGLPWPDCLAQGPVPARLRLAAPRPTDVTVHAGNRSTTTTVGPSPRWVDLTLDPGGGATVGGPIEGRLFDVIQNAGSVLLSDGYGADRGFRQRDAGQFDEPAEVWGWCGGAVLLRARYLREVGGFWPPFFMYYEDMDLAWRGRARGWRYRYEPASRVRHLHGKSAGEGSATFEHYVERNRLVALTRNAPPGLVVTAVARYLLAIASMVRRDLRLAVAARRPPRFRQPRRRLRSFAAYLCLLPRLLVERRRVRAVQVVADDELLRWMQPRSSHPA